MRHPATKSSRGKSGTTSQGPSFRTGSSELTSSMPVNSMKITSSIMKAIKLSTVSRRSDAIQYDDASTRHAKHHEQHVDAGPCHRRKKDPSDNPNQHDSTCTQPRCSQPCESNQESKAWAGEPPQIDQVRARDLCKQEKKTTSRAANSTSRRVPPPSKAARNQTDAARMRPLPKCTKLHNFLDKVNGGASDPTISHFRNSKLMQIVYKHACTVQKGGQHKQAK